MMSPGDLLKKVARKLLVDMGPDKMSGDEFIGHCERTFRDSKLEALIESGQAMREAGRGDEDKSQVHIEADARWDDAIAWIEEEM